MYEGQELTSLQDACARPGKQGKARPKVVCNQGTDSQNSILCLQYILRLNHELDQLDDTARDHVHTCCMLKCFSLWDEILK